MINSNLVLGSPLRLYVNTKSNIEALVGLTEGCQSYASDTNQVGIYDGSSWIWGYTPDIHDIISSHSTSGRTAGQILQATGATTFGWSTNTLTLTTSLTNQGASGVLNWSGAYTLTVPATGTVALLATANNFTVGQTITVAGTQLTLVNGATNTTLRNESYGYLTITPSGGAVSIPASLLANYIAVSRDIAAQTVLSTANDLWYVYPYMTFDRSRGTQSSRTDDAAGDIAGGVNFYARYLGGGQGVATFAAYVDTASGSYLSGRLVFNVNDGTSGGANGFGFSVRSGGTVFGTDTTPTGRLNVIGSTNIPQLYIVGYTTQTDSVAKFLRNDGATNSVNPVVTIGANSTGTAAAGFGARQLWTLESSTTADTSAASIDVAWNTATHASRKADMIFYAYDTSAREFLRGQGNGSAAAIGFLGATPITQPANTVAINDVLVNFGLRASGGESNFSTRTTYPGTYAAIHVHDASTAQNIATGTTYVKITAFTDNGFSNNCTPDATNDKITITKAGLYRVVGSVSFADDTNNVTWFASIFLNGVEQDQIHFTRKIGTAGDVGNAALTGIIDVTSVPWDLDLRMRHDAAGTVAITVSYANLNIEYVGET